MGRPLVHCELCSKDVAGGPGGWRGHTNGLSHKQRAAKQPTYIAPTYDSLAKKFGDGPENFSSTFPPRNVGVGRGRSSFSRSSPSPPAPSPQPSSSLFTKCMACDNEVLTRYWDIHLDSDEHMTAVATQKSLIPSRPPKVRQNLPLDPSHPNTVLCPQCRIIVHHLDLAQHLQSPSHEAHVNPQNNLPATPLHPGRHTEPVLGDQSRDPTSAANQAHHEPVSSGTGPSEPIIPEQSTSVWSKRQVDQAQPAPNAPHLALNPWEDRWDLHPIPEDIQKVFVSDTQCVDQTLEAARKLLPPTLALGNYRRLYKTLLFIEEMQKRNDVAKIKVEGATLVQDGNYYHLEINNSANDNAPLVGDTIIVKPQNHPSNKPPYEARIHHVSRTGATLHFDQTFKQDQGQLFDITFQSDRIAIQRMHEALMMPLNPLNRRRLLFPELEHFDVIISSPSGNPQFDGQGITNREILNNPQQLLAVKTIVTRPASSPPLIIWGAANTGKTTVAIEGIRQVLLQNPSARILACAPSETAADHLAQQLLDVGTEALFRLNSASRPVFTLPANLLPFSSVIKLDRKRLSEGQFLLAGTDEGFEFFSYPSCKDLAGFRVVVSTCNGGGEPHGVGLPRGHFSHIFIDDAGRTIEPDAMIPILTMAEYKTNVILFGDHKHLGPAVSSPIAGTLGLGISYFDRLMSLPPYQETSSSAAVAVVKLSHNFKTHPAILKFASDTFYGGLLKATFPIVFHAVKRKGSQGSAPTPCSNHEEALVVNEYVEKLKSEGLSHSDLGIIAPYREQCKAIGSLVSQSDRGGEACKVGVIEEFEGQGRKAVIISTVVDGQVIAANTGSNQDLGFVGQPRRFNAAITLAHDLLIVVGDPSALKVDSDWASFMNYIHTNGGWRGDKSAWVPTESPESKKLVTEDLKTYVSHSK